MQRTQMLRHVLAIEAQVQTFDPDTNAPILSWSVVHEGVPCGYYPQSGREFVAAGAVRNAQTVRFLLAYDPTLELTTRHRIEFDGVRYPILAVLPDPSARGHLNVICEAGVHAQ